MQIHLAVHLGLVLTFGMALAAAPPADAQSTLTDLKATFRRPIAAPISAETAATIEVGRDLFYDTGLSATGAMSCGTCHVADLAWKDGRARSLDNRGQPLARRTPTLLDLAGTEVLNWDGHQKTLLDQATDPIAIPRIGAMTPQAMVAHVENRLEHDPVFAARYQAAFAAQPVTRATMARALAAFEASLVSPPAPFDRWIDGDPQAISPAAQRGFALFNGRGNCAVCHQGWRFTDDGFHDIGLPDADLGRGGLFPAIPTLQHTFKTPTLRGVAVGPYMHDGSLTTLEAVVDHYDARFVTRPSLDPDMRAIELSPTERADLLAFLQSLSPARSATALSRKSP